MGDPLVVYNAAPEPVEGWPFLRRIRLAHRDFLSSGILPLTWRALATFDPGVLWTLLHGLEYLPGGPRVKPARSGEERDEETEMDAAKGRLANAVESNRPELVSMAHQMLVETRDRVVVTARQRRGGARKESSRRRYERVLPALLAGLPDWSMIDVARLVLESPTWNHPPCPRLAHEYTDLDAELADAFTKGLRRASGRNTPL